MLNPIITLTTDFGTSDGYVGAMKGRFMTMVPDALLIDITHDIAPQDIVQAAWALKRSVFEYPPGTVHVAVIDPGVGGERQALAVQTEDYWLIGPDNGVFTKVLQKSPPIGVWALHAETPYWSKHHSFDGLALFTPAAAYLANDNPVEHIAKQATSFVSLPAVDIERTEAGMVGQILFFDRFGNAITNIDRRQLPAKTLAIQVKDLIVPLVRCYSHGDMPIKAIINSDGLLEICSFQGSAKEMLGLVQGDPIGINWH
tara:strand:+ start:431 stop:1201 length:771 start_codon:yes stop_codon:yes gene_type:complete